METKKKADLEQLLNSLIEKGWKPRGEYKIHSCKYIEWKFKSEYTIAWLLQVLYRSLRELVSKESWLWQFVCENGMVRRIEANSWYIWELVDNYSDDDEVIKRYNSFWEKGSDYQYRLIESSLKDESELEDFLLSNIKVGWE